MSKTQHIQIILRSRPTPNPSSHITLNPLDKTIDIETGYSEETSAMKKKMSFNFNGMRTSFSLF